MKANFPELETEIVKELARQTQQYQEYMYPILQILMKFDAAM